MVGWGWGSLFQLGPLPHPPGIMVQGAGSSALLQFSSDGLHWHNYTDILPGILPPAKVRLPEPPGPVAHHCLCPRAPSSLPEGHSYLRGLLDTCQEQGLSKGHQKLSQWLRCKAGVQSSGGGGE